MLKILISAPDYKVINDLMWELIIFCNKNKIIFKKINWGKLFIKTDNCKIKYCLFKEVKKILKQTDYDAIFNWHNSKDLLKYVKEVEKLRKCILKED